jgi:hypothetical protein
MGGSCRYWKKDLYKYWQPSSFVDASSTIVSECACASGDVLDRRCLNTWDQGNSSNVAVSSPESVVILPENKFIGLFNHTFEFRVAVREFIAGQPTKRSQDKTMMVTVHNQDDSRYISYMLHREINLELNVDTSKLPPTADATNFVPYTPLSITGYITNADGERIMPGQIPMGQGKPVFECPGGLPEDVNGIDKMCWFEWQEKVGTDLADASLSRFAPYQHLSESAGFGLRTGLMQADSSFVVRLNMVKGIDEASRQIDYAFFETKIEINALPRNGYARVEDYCGFGVLADFEVSANDWNDDPEDLPLAYAFFFQRLGWDDDPFAFTEFAYSSRHVFKLPYAEKGDPCKGIVDKVDGKNVIDVGIKNSQYCKVLEVSAMVRNLNDAFIVSSTTVDIWRPQFATDNAEQRGGKVTIETPAPDPAYVKCNGDPEVTGLQDPLEYIQAILPTAFAYGFANSNQAAMDMAIRNGAIFYNNELPQLEKLYGSQEPGFGYGYGYRQDVLDQVILKMISLNRLPKTPEGIESLSSVLLELFGHATAKVDLCAFATVDLQKIIYVVETLIKHMNQRAMRVRVVVLKSLIKVADTVTECLLTGEPFEVELFQHEGEDGRSEAQSARRSESPQEYQEESYAARRENGARNKRRAMVAAVLEKRMLIAWNFNSGMSESLCTLSMNSEDERNEDQVEIKGDRHTFVFRRAYPWTKKEGFRLTPSEKRDSAGNVLCGGTEIVVEGGIGGGKIDVCAAVFHYNPVDYPGVMTGAFTSNGQSQKQYGVPWPLHPRMCPVRLSFHSVPRAQGADRIHLPATIVSRCVRRLSVSRTCPP